MITDGRAVLAARQFSANYNRKKGTYPLVIRSIRRNGPLLASTHLPRLDHGQTQN